MGGIIGDNNEELATTLLFDLQYNIIDTGIGVSGTSNTKFQTYLSGGVRHAFGKENTQLENLKYEDVTFLPVGAGIRLELHPFYISLNGGYALSLQDEIDDGLLFRPSFSIINFPFHFLNLTVSYENISIEGTSLEAVYGGLLFIFD